MMHCRFPRQGLACVHIFSVDKHIGHELLNIPSRYLVEPLVTYGRIDTLGELFHSRIRSWSEVDFGIFLKPLLCEFLELNSRCYLSPLAFFLEQDSLMKLSITLDTFPTRIMKRSVRRQPLRRIFAVLQLVGFHQSPSRSCGCSSNS